MSFTGSFGHLSSGNNTPTELDVACWFVLPPLFWKQHTDRVRCRLLVRLAISLLETTHRQSWMSLAGSFSHHSSGNNTLTELDVVYWFVWPSLFWKQHTDRVGCRLLVRSPTTLLETTH